MPVSDSPVMQQYNRLKAAHAGFWLWFRMGDFFELFGQDAIEAAEVLGVTLTRRRTAQEGDEGIPMCGVPYHAVDGYIAKALNAGFRVALAEQTETPEEAKRARGSSALVNRAVVRLYTPGTLTEDNLLDASRPNYLAAIAVDDASHPTLKHPWRGGIAWLDLSTGDVGVRTITDTEMSAVVAALSPGEVVVPPLMEERLEGLITRRQLSVQDSLFNTTRATEAIKRAYGVEMVAGLGIPDGITQTALGALLAYAELTQLGKLPALKTPSVHTNRSTMAIDPATRRSLELTESLAGQRRDSLLGEIDRCITAPGSRLLGRWVAEPSADMAVIHTRQHAVEALVNTTDTRTSIRTLLKETGDVARCVSRLLLERGGPRDLSVLRQTGHQLPALVTHLRGLDNPLLSKQADGLNGLRALTDILSRALNDDPLPALVRDGGFIRDGFDPSLDAARVLMTDGNTLLAELEARESAASGMDLKLRYNKVWGYYLEVTKAQLDKVGGQLPPYFVHRQTTTNSHRYTTEQLMDFERKLGSASAEAQAREEAVFKELVGHVKIHSAALLAVSEALATTDALAALADLAARGGWVKPLVDDSTAFDIEQGRHPVVANRVGDFVPNDCHLSGGRLWLITGPNMAGKSTFLRQNALILVLAQIGSFVPAANAHIGVADALFSRIGAADNLAAGQSTFMVEMVETAHILNRATPKSLIILDELGRGTATYDGLAIAWACVEHVAQTIKARTLFATHYHELTSLSESIPSVSSHHVAVKEWKGDIVFLHKVIDGAAAGSYGVHVAKLAGIPANVVQRADHLLNGFLKAAKGKGAVRLDELSLFANPVLPTPTPAHGESEIERRLKALDVDALSAREALEQVYQWRELVQAPPSNIPAATTNRPPTTT